MLNSLRSGKSLAALFGDVFGNIKGSFLTTTENLIQQSQSTRVAGDDKDAAGGGEEHGYVRFDESMAEADEVPPELVTAAADRAHVEKGAAAGAGGGAEAAAAAPPPVAAGGGGGPPV